MCGLVGISSNNLVHKDKQFFSNLLYIDQLRGEHSTGVLGVNKKGVPSVYKRALKAADFLQLKGHSAVCLHADHLLMGHNRYATVGAKDDNNAHPFTHGAITLAHNGTLKNKYAVNSDKRTFDTDSETIAYALSCENYLEVLERLEGAYALTWFDEEDGTINFARNSERELYLGFVGNDLVWASEREMLQLVAGHMKKTLKDVELLPVGEHRMYELGKIQEGFFSSKFVPKKPAPVKSYSTRGSNYSRTAHKTSGAGTSMVATIIEVRQTGYLQAATPKGSMVICTVPKENINSWLDAAARGDSVIGTVVSCSQRWIKNNYVDCYSLSSKGLQIIEKNTEKEGEAETKEEKKCHACLLSIHASDPGEEHYGETYHSSCLDWLQNNRYNLNGRI